MCLVGSHCQRHYEIDGALAVSEVSCIVLADGTLHAMSLASGSCLLTQYLNHCD